MTSSHISRTCIRRTSVIALSLIAGCGTKSQEPNQPVPTESSCNARAVELASDVQALRGVISRCRENAQVYQLAVDRLNRLEPAKRRQIALQIAPDAKDSERVELRADVFFEFQEAYPPEIAFVKLDELILKINQGYAIQSVQVVGSAAPNEPDSGGARLAELRVDFLRRYFSNAGLDLRKFSASERGPVQPNTPEGRARDRVAEIAVVLYRKKPAGY